MRITFIIKKLNTRGGGSSHSLDLLATSLANRGHRIKVVTIRSSQNNLPRHRPYKIIEETDHPTPIGSTYAVKSLINKYTNSTDIFHIFSPSLLTGAGLYKKLGGSTKVFGRLNSYLFCTNLDKMDGKCYKSCTTAAKFKHDNSNTGLKIAATPFYTFRTYFTPKLINQVDMLFAQSPSVKNIYKSIGVQDDTITVISNFYDPTFRKYTHEPSEQAQPENLLYVGRLKKRKGVHILLESIKQLAPTIDHLYLDIVGDGPELDPLKNRAKELGINDCVKFHGYIPHDELDTFYNKSGIFIHPSLWPEPSGRTILEAMQYRCVPIVSNIGGPPWIVGEAGTTFTPGSAEELTDSVYDILNTKAKYVQKKNQCSKELKRFDEETIVSKIESKYLDGRSE